MMLCPAHFHFPAPQPVAAATGPGAAMDQHQPQPPVLCFRKRKAEDKPEGNERLSKRMSLLNLEQSGAKLYVPVESQHPNPSLSPTAYRLPTPSPSSASADNEMMALDDTKYKVYIRNLDDELTSSDDDEPSNGDNLVINLPDIQKHLRANRIPPAVLRSAAPPDLDKQLVLYRLPSSLTVPEEQDSVRKAILEARARLRGEREVREVQEVDMDADDEGEGSVVPSPVGEEDPDAMELD